MRAPEYASVFHSLETSARTTNAKTRGQTERKKRLFLNVTSATDLDGAEVRSCSAAGFHAYTFSNGMYLCNDIHSIMRVLLIYVCAKSFFFNRHLLQASTAHRIHHVDLVAFFSC